MFSIIDIDNRTGERSPWVMMKVACVILTLIISVAIMAVCVMVKFATDIRVEERARELQPAVGRLASGIAVVALNENSTVRAAQRFPYIAAIASNSTKSFSFACFASVILYKWVVTSAHCRRRGALHRVLLFSDFAKNLTRTFPILFWRIHHEFDINSTIPFYDIAIAKFNVDDTRFTIKPSTFDNKSVEDCEASVWKTVSAMDRKIYLVNDFDTYSVKIAAASRCYETYGIQVDESMICVDLSDHDDCFTHEFGPIYSEDKVVGVLAAKPKDCEVKYAIFTNVSFYATWIIKLTAY
ncbi:uncharacterized protein LOC112043883 [Bicyclus anynana]|uniref:Uncharacterized protein LOC112043883 n=1 Tax=Bicyclus anynana TaxID=110368 RepID=A0A6J1MLJ6_BICAN|nr:uncharacterized protein LOC112043883 [Bicyclus anynana]